MRLRPESSVSPDVGQWGDLAFPGANHGAVVHRTPEELGLPRVVRDEAPGALMPWIDRTAVMKVRRARALPMGEAAREREKELRELEAQDVAEPEPAVRIIAGEPVRLSASAVMGAELIGDLKKERGKMNDFKLDDELNAKIVADIGLPASELVAKYGVPVSRIYGLRCQLRRDGKLPANLGRSVRKPQKKAAVMESTQAVDTAPQSMVQAELTGIIEIALKLSDAEVARVLAGFNPARRAAFLSAGLRAALTA